MNRYAELQNYSELPFSLVTDSTQCDVIIDKPTILIKLDAGYLTSYLSVYLRRSSRKRVTK